MRFITENELRDLYRQEPFTSFTLQTDERLTPGARQYLLDKGINMYDDAASKAAHGAGVRVGAGTSQSASETSPAAGIAGYELPRQISFEQQFMTQTGMSRQELILRVQSLEKMSLAIAEELHMISSVLGGEKECQKTETADL